MRNRFDDDIELKLDRDFEREPRVRRRSIRNPTEYTEQARENVALAFGASSVTEGE